MKLRITAVAVGAALVLSGCSVGTKLAGTAVSISGVVVSEKALTAEVNEVRSQLESLPTGKVQQILDVGRGKPVGQGRRRLPAQFFAQTKERPPEVVEEIHDQPCPRMAQCVQLPEEKLDIGGKVDRLGDDDEVVAVGQCQQLVVVLERHHRARRIGRRHNQDPI